MVKCKSKLAIRALLYGVDTIGGKTPIMQDDMWAVTTDELNDIEERLNKSFANGVLAGQRQTAQAIDAVQSAMFNAKE